MAKSIVVDRVKAIWAMTFTRSTTIDFDTLLTSVLVKPFGLYFIVYINRLVLSTIKLNPLLYFSDSLWYSIFNRRIRDANRRID